MLTSLLPALHTTKYMPENFELGARPRHEMQSKEAIRSAVMRQVTMQEKRGRRRGGALIRRLPPLSRQGTLKPLVLKNLEVGRLFSRSQKPIHDLAILRLHPYLCDKAGPPTGHFWQAVIYGMPMADIFSRLLVDWMVGSTLDLRNLQYDLNSRHVEVRRIRRSRCVGALSGAGSIGDLCCICKRRLIGLKMQRKRRKARRKL